FPYTSLFRSFIKIPTTSYPCSFKSKAVTEESTPPLIPTTTRVFAFSFIVSPSFLFRFFLQARKLIENLIEFEGSKFPTPHIIRFYQQKSNHSVFFLNMNLY